MAERNERPMFEGNNRRENERRQAERRKEGRIKIILKYIAIGIVMLAAIKYLRG